METCAVKPEPPKRWGKSQPPRENPNDILLTPTYIPIPEDVPPHLHSIWMSRQKYMLKHHTIGVCKYLGRHQENRIWDTENNDWKRKEDGSIMYYGIDEGEAKPMLKHVKNDDPDAEIPIKAIPIGLHLRRIWEPTSKYNRKDNG